MKWGIPRKRYERDCSNTVHVICRTILTDTDNKAELNIVDYVKVVLNKNVGSANTAWISQILGGLEEKMLLC